MARPPVMNLARSRPYAFVAAVAGVLAVVLALAAGHADSGPADTGQAAAEFLPSFARAREARDSGLEGVAPHYRDVLASFNIDLAESRLVYSNSSRDHGPRKIFVAPVRDEASLCTIAVEDGVPSSVFCDSLSEFADGRRFAAVIRNEGRPAAPTNVEIIGVASRLVDRIDVDAGRFQRTIRPDTEGGFWVRETEPVIPTRLVARSVDGREVGRLDLPRG